MVCNGANPCRSFAAAYSVTSSGGEIVTLGPGGYGPLTITGAVAIAGVDGAGIEVTTGVGITINAGAGNNVIIRNLQINGGLVASTTGIQLNSGNLVLVNSTLKLLTTGLSVSSSIADIVHTDIIGNTTGISTTGTGTDVSGSQPVWGATQARMAYGNVLDNTTAFLMNNPGFGSTGPTNKPNNITIEEYTTANGFTTNIAGNTTMIAGSGTTCASYQVTGTSTYTVYRCNAIYQYTDSTNYQPHP